MIQDEQFLFRLVVRIIGKWTFLAAFATGTLCGAAAARLGYDQWAPYAGIFGFFVGLAAAIMVRLLRRG
jgi:hypothetical protein